MNLNRLVDIKILYVISGLDEDVAAWRDITDCLLNGLTSFHHKWFHTSLGFAKQNSDFCIVDPHSKKPFYFQYQDEDALANLL